MLKLKHEIYRNLELRTHSNTWYGIIMVYVQILLLVNIPEMILFYWFQSCSNNAKNWSDPITGLLTGSTVVDRLVIWIVICQERDSYDTGWWACHHKVVSGLRSGMYDTGWWACHMNSDVRRGTLTILIDGLVIIWIWKVTSVRNGTHDTG